MNSEVSALVSLLDSGGTLALAVVIILSLVRGWVVTRREFDSIVEDRNQWRDIALSSTDLANRAVNVAQQPVRRGK